MSTNAAGVLLALDALGPAFAGGHGSLVEAVRDVEGLLAAVEDEEAGILAGHDAERREQSLPSSRRRRSTTACAAITATAARASVRIGVVTATMLPASKASCATARNPTSVTTAP